MEEDASIQDGKTSQADTSDSLKPPTDTDHEPDTVDESSVMDDEVKTIILYPSSSLPHTITNFLSVSRSPRIPTPFLRIPLPIRRHPMATLLHPLKRLPRVTRIGTYHLTPSLDDEIKISFREHDLETIATVNPDELEDDNEEDEEATEFADEGSGPVDEETQTGDNDEGEDTTSNLPEDEDEEEEEESVLEAAEGEEDADEASHVLDTASSADLSVHLLHLHHHAGATDEAEWTSRLSKKVSPLFYCAGNPLALVSNPLIPPKPKKRYIPLSLSLSLSLSFSLCANFTYFYQVLRSV